MVTRRESNNLLLASDQSAGNYDNDDDAPKPALQ